VYFYSKHVIRRTVQDKKVGLYFTLEIG
jgi:hypothetical protein